MKGKGSDPEHIDEGGKIILGIGFLFLEKIHSA
jgi:hypothetical protein